MQIIKPGMFSSFGVKHLLDLISLDFFPSKMLMRPLTTESNLKQLLVLFGLTVLFKFLYLNCKLFPFMTVWHIEFYFGYDRKWIRD